MGLAVQLLDACERDPDAQPAPARRVCLFASAAAARVVLGGVQGTSYCRIRSVLPICTYHGRTTIHSLDGQAAYVYVGCTYSLPQAQGTARVPTACRPPALLGTLHVALLRNTMQRLLCDAGMGQCGHKLHAAWAHAEYCLPCLSMLWHCPLLLRTLNGSADGCARKSCTFTLQEQYPDLKFPPIPVRGELDLEEVRNSPYFFS